jgi:hypothetical protein
MKKTFEHFEFKSGQEEQQKIAIKNYLNDSQAYVTCGLTDEGKPWVEISRHNTLQLNVILQSLQEHLNILHKIMQQRN